MKSTKKIYFRRYFLLPYLLMMVNFLPAICLAENSEKVLQSMHWFGQAAIRIDTRAGKKIYIDPYRLKNPRPADLILITHCHSDHLSLVDIEKIVTPQTSIIAPADCAAKIEPKVAKKVGSILPGKTLTIKGITIEAVPAYNVVKTNFHPRSNNWVGYIVNVDGVRVYHAGDTERIPQMKNIDADIALLPLGQTYTMNLLTEAGEAALDIKAGITIPIHYGLYEGKKTDGHDFAEKLQGKLKVVVMDQE